MQRGNHLVHRLRAVPAAKPHVDLLLEDIERRRLVAVVVGVRVRVFFDDAEAFDDRAHGAHAGADVRQVVLLAKLKKSRLCPECRFGWVRDVVPVRGCRGADGRRCCVGEAGIPSALVRNAPDVFAVVDGAATTDDAKNAVDRSKVQVFEDVDLVVPDRTAAFTVNQKRLRRRTVQRREMRPCVDPPCTFALPG